MKIFLLFALFAISASEDAGCIVDDVQHSTGDTWRVTSVDAVTGEPTEFVRKCFLSGKSPIMACVDAEHDVEIPLRQSRRFAGEGNDTIVRCQVAFSALGVGYFLSRKSSPARGCRDASGQSRRFGERWTEARRSVVVECRRLSATAFHLVDVACEAPDGERIEVGEETAQFRCVGFGRGPNLRLYLGTFATSPAARIAGKKEAINSTLQVVMKQKPDPTNAQPNPEERAALMRGTACWADGQLRPIGTSWKSADGSQEVTCAIMSERASSQLLHCLSPGGARIPKGGLATEGGRLFRCLPSARREELATTADGRLCRAAPGLESRAELAARNARVLQANRKFLAETTTAEDVAEYRRLMHTAVFREYRTIVDNKLYKALLQLRPLDRLRRRVCYRLDCDGSLCYRGATGQVSFSRACLTGPCTKPFNRSYGDEATN